MSSQITHSQTLPKNVDYWDYYILCRCDDAVSKVLQRMEFWDGTKVGGNGHGEQINDNLKESKRAPTQDTSRFVYKTREELAWELIGAVKERSAYEALDTLANTLHYLKSRHNPYKTFDRTLQYEFQVRLVQKHLDDLYIIIKCFIDHGRQCRPILYAIEQLTQEGVYINRVEQKDGTLDGTDTLTIAAVAERLSLLHKQMHIDEEEGQKKLEEGQKKHKPLLPTFLKQDLRKDEANEFDADFPLCKNAQCIHAFLHNASGRFCTIDCANLHGPLCKNAQAIPVITTEITNSNYNTERENDGVGSIEHNTPPPFDIESAIALLAQNGYGISLPHQGSEQSHAPSFPTDPDAKGDVSPTQDSGFLPSPQSENASAHTNTSIGVSQSSQATSASPQSEKTALSTNEQSKQASYSREHAHETPDTVTSEKPKRPSRANKPPVEKPAPPDPTAEEIAAKEVAEAMNKRCGAWQGRINKWRGYELEKRGAIINERHCIRKLCEKYTDIEIKRVYSYLFKDDWKWSKPDNRYKIGASEVLEEAGRVIQQLSGKSAPPTDDDIPDNVTPINGRSSTTESSTDLRVMAAKAREMAAAQGGK